MKKLLRYLVNTILFVAIWCIPAFIFVGISLSVSGTRPSAIAGVGGIVAIIISYRLVKRINKSNLWSSLFDETEVINDVVEEKKVEVVEEKTKKKVEVEDSNIGARIIGAIICIVVGGVSANITIETYNKINDTATFEDLTGIIPPKQSAKAVVQLMIDVGKNDEEIRDFIKWQNNEKGESKKIVEFFLNHIQSNRHTILYSSVFVFCVSLCCFTYICVKK